MERKIGEVFEYEGKALRVEEYKDNVNECFGCFFDGKCFSLKAVGHCEAERRTDKKNVIFVEVKKETKEQQQEEQKLNLCEILKDCPKGWEFYSSVYGEVRFIEITPTKPVSCKSREDEWFGQEVLEYKYPVKFMAGICEYSVSKAGKLKDGVGECTFFPSREQRDWSKFTAPWYKKEKFDPKTLKPFDRVLCKNGLDMWRCDFFSSYMETYVCQNVCISGSYSYCIPYNDDTKHLVGTKEEAPDFYKYWED